MRRTPTRSLDYEEELLSEIEGEDEEESANEEMAPKGTRKQEGVRSKSTTTRTSSMVRVLKWQGGGAGRSTAPEALRGRSSPRRQGQEDEPSSSSTQAIQAVSEAEKAARIALRAANAADRAAESAEAVSEMLQRAAEKPVSKYSQLAEKVPTNPWNRFQKMNAKKGWSMDRMRAEYWKSSAGR